MKKLILILTLCFQCLNLIAQNEADIDPAFVNSGFIEDVYCTKLQPDGKILVGGAFEHYDGTLQKGLIRLNSDGSKDTSFNIGSGFDVYAGNAVVYSIELQSDGKILVGGTFTYYNGTSQKNLIRLNSNGSKDTSFIISDSFSIYPGIETKVNSIVLQPDGKILVGGNFLYYQGIAQNYLIRLNDDGSKDTSFGSGFSHIVQSIVLQPDGKILVGGLFTAYNGTTQNRLIRLNIDGSKDTSFNIGSGFDNTVESIALQSDGKILVGGYFTTYNGITQNKLIRLNSDGSKDTAFTIGSGFNVQVYSIALQLDGKILVGGQFATYNEITQNRLIRLDSNGSKDTSFNIGSGFIGPVNSIALQPDGKILLGGGFISYKGTSINRIIRLKGVTALSTASFEEKKLFLFPNPVKDILNISLSENTSIEKYAIYDLLGKKVISKNTVENFINVSELSSGVYMLKVVTNEGIITNKFIKE